MCYDEALKSRHSEPKAKNLTEKQILRSACGLPQDDGVGADGLPQDDGEDKGVKWQKTRRMSTEESVYCCAPSDDEWVESYRTTLLFLKGLFQYEASRSTRITQTEGSSTTLLESKDS